MGRKLSLFALIAALNLRSKGYLYEKQIENSLCLLACTNHTKRCARSSGSSCFYCDNQARCESKQKKHKKQSKTKRVNKALKKALKEDQGFAEGKLDASGNPTDNGTPNSEYDFATYVSSLKYQSNGAVKVQMNGKVQDVTLVEMDTIANKVQGLVDSTLMVENVIKPEDVSKGTYLRFFYGQRALGHSNLSDHTKFKWYTD